MDIGYTWGGGQNMDGFAKDVLPKSGGAQNMVRFEKDVLSDGYRVFLRGTQNIDGFAKDVLPK